MTRRSDRPEVVFEHGCPVLAGYDPLDPDVFRDIGPWMEVARAEAPVFYVPKFDDWVVTRAADIQRVLSDTETFTMSGTESIVMAVPPEVAPELPLGFALAESFAFKEAAEHARLRPFLQGAFAKRQALLKTEIVREVANAALDEIIDAGSADLASEWCNRLAVGVLSRILGFAEADQEAVHRWGVALVRIFSSRGLSHQEHVEYARDVIEMERYAEAIVADRRVNPGDENDFLTNLIRAQDPEGHESRLTDRNIMGIVMNSMFAGVDTSATSLGLILHVLLSDRARWESLLSDRGSLDRVVEEGMRLVCPAIALFRRVTREAEVGGVTVPEGATLRLHVWSASHDERFADPMNFDPERTNLRDHMAFGRGPHTCPGQHLARVEIRVGLETLLDRIPSVRMISGDLEIPPHEIQSILKGGLVVEWDERSPAYTVSSAAV